MLVPFEVQGNLVKCFGDKERDYADDILEIEVLYGMKVTLERITAAELHRLLGCYYRSDSESRHRQTHSMAEIGSSQGFLMGIIEEAFDIYASDIHIEAYEERQRVRFRIDGKLIERYVIEKSNYASLINQIKIIAGLDISEKRLP
ncbi:MAG: Flp pilus assembly complex ATPase component TadA, partial [Lachnoclostridium sp.]|nr:Flp pilus assembly complex ATPase component TadA [Lachnoclostridium sp.]